MTTNNSTPVKKLRILELFSGIGGLHWALKVASVPCKVVAAMEINPIVLETYKHNFGDTNVIRKNLEGITADEINELDIDAIVMSPPCQPFCRTGNRLDVQDKRTGPLTRITEILPDLNLKYIFVENVQGFEGSTARDNVLKALRELNFTWQEFMLSPKTVGIPNSRLRYYLIGKHVNIPWSFEVCSESLLSEVPNWDYECEMPFFQIRKQQEMLVHSWRKRWKEVDSRAGKLVDESPLCVGDFIDWEMSDEAVKELKVSDSVLNKYLQAMDIVTPLSVCTCCFTKGYGHFVKGTGSILNFKGSSNPEIELDSTSDNDLDLKTSLRYFSPKEISRLMCYPDKFEFPEKLTRNQKYRSLGNSVNVYVVAILFSLLFS